MSLRRRPNGSRLRRRFEFVLVRSGDSSFHLQWLFDLAQQRVREPANFARSHAIMLALACMHAHVHTFMQVALPYCRSQVGRGIFL